MAWTRSLHSRRTAMASLRVRGDHAAGVGEKMVESDGLLAECRKLALEIASCVPETVKIYKSLVNEGLEMDLAAGLAMERHVMTHANKHVSGDAIGSRREQVQQRGKTQSPD